MKINGIITIVLPYYEHDGTRQYCLIRLNGPIDSRRIKRGIRKFIKENFNMYVNNDWLRNVPLIHIAENVTNNTVEDFIQRIKCDDFDEDETQGHSYCKASSA